MAHLLSSLGSVLLVPPDIIAIAIQTPAPDQLHLPQMYHHPWFVEVIAASTLGWIFGLRKGFAGTKVWLGAYFARTPAVVPFFLDFVIYVVVGGFFGVGIYNPTTLHAALAAGLSWPVGFGALATRD